MVNENCGNDVTVRVQQTLRDATDMTYGADNAAARLQTDIWNNYQQLGGSVTYNAYLDQVTNGLAHNQLLPEIAACWVAHNTGRFDMTGDGRVDPGEINTAIGRTHDPLEREMLMTVRDSFQNIRHAAGEDGFGARGNSIGQEDVNRYEGQIQAGRQQANAQALQQQHNRQLMQPLLATDDGNPQRSLFAVLDNVTGGAQDGQISEHDLKSFVEQYDRAAMNGGDVNQGVWTRSNRDFAQSLVNNWNTPEIRNLRTELEYDDDNNLVMQTGSYISQRSLLTAAGYGAGTNLWQAFETPPPQPVAAPVEVQPVAQAQAPAQANDICRSKAPLHHGPTPEQIAQARADFQRQLQAHIDQEAHYTVRPGQGYDVIARDVIKAHTNDGSYKDPHKIVAYSDHIAKMNGRSGRLAKTPCLQPGEQLQVFDDDWVKAQIAARMRIFDKSMPCKPTVPSDDPGY